MLSQSTEKKYCINNKLQLWLALKEDMQGATEYMTRGSDQDAQGYVSSWMELLS